MLRFVSIAALIVAGAITTARADVYRWVDEHGQPHYSDQWVPGSEVIKTGRVVTRPEHRAHAASTRRSQRLEPARSTPQLSEEANARAAQQDVSKSA